LLFLVETVGSQQTWDTFVKDRSGGDGSVLGLPEQVVAAFAAGQGWAFTSLLLIRTPSRLPWRTLRGAYIASKR